LQLLAFHVERGRIDGCSLARDEIHGKKSARARACPITDSRRARSAERSFRSAAHATAASSTAASSVATRRVGGPRVMPTAAIGGAPKVAMIIATRSALAARGAWGITVPRS
jgi:hypothetical protein